MEQKHVNINEYIGENLSGIFGRIVNPENDCGVVILNEIIYNLLNLNDNYPLNMKDYEYLQEIIIDNINEKKIKNEGFVETAEDVLNSYLFFINNSYFGNTKSFKNIKKIKIKFIEQERRKLELYKGVEALKNIVKKKHKKYKLAKVNKNICYSNFKESLFRARENGAKDIFSKIYFGLSSINLLASKLREIFVGISYSLKKIKFNRQNRKLNKKLKKSFDISNEFIEILKIKKTKTFKKEKKVGKIEENIDCNNEKIEDLQIKRKELFKKFKKSFEKVENDKSNKKLPIIRLSVNSFNLGKNIFETSVLRIKNFLQYRKIKKIYGENIKKNIAEKNDKNQLKKYYGNKKFLQKYLNSFKEKFKKFNNITSRFDLLEKTFSILKTVAGVLNLAGAKEKFNNLANNNKKILVNTKQNFVKKEKEIM